MTQFGSWRHHTAMDAAAVLTHQIQATQAAGHTGTLILFDISGFFDNLNPQHTIHILRIKGFPNTICKWALSFLTEWTANLQMGDFTSDPFPISYGTPQGSPLSPILSALYTSPLLASTQHWVHWDLTMYVNDGAIYTVSATANTATLSAVQGLEATLQWLH